MSTKTDPESVIMDIKRKTRKKYTSEEKTRIILEGMRGEESIATIYRRDNSKYYYCRLIFLRIAAFHSQMK